MSRSLSLFKALSCHDFREVKGLHVRDSRTIDDYLANHISSLPANIPHKIPKRRAFVNWLNDYDGGKYDNLLLQCNVTRSSKEVFATEDAVARNAVVEEFSGMTPDAIRSIKVEVVKSTWSAVRQKLGLPDKPRSDTWARKLRKEALVRRIINDRERRTFVVQGRNVSVV
eukprot:CAMPEP_0196825696 /NCGR_PEP_ID=MMETSP1362-20130617/93211_1 /TAXON_ID=163516 /ORGANISM="Leptocylindrus danicus, Strain CCMP1856" /LENGTH=169 /DNA_ID=CAMNT_0042206177 /DNA_START=62 /DNA_END=571 /DNA_ORIENTATION=-